MNRQIPIGALALFLLAVVITLCVIYH